MEYIADLHLHGKYSRAVSRQMELPVMAQYARRKGLDILSTGDFTHPMWLKEISSQLEEESDGIYALKSESSDASESHPDPLLRGEGSREVYFILSTEIASIYKQGDKLRRIHNLIFSPSLEVVEKINSSLLKKGCNLSSDGRPIIGLTSKQLLELIMEADERCFLIPCHIWTPHFGLLGSASGFTSIEEAFGDYAKFIYGIETGLSSDPDMNWSVNELRNRSIISNSDAHSPAKMGREATVFELTGNKPTYGAIKEAIMRPMSTVSKVSKAGGKLVSDTSRIKYTLEFYPEEGKYHFSGHRNCKISYGPEEIREKGTVCPVCHKKMTEGVLLRVRELADPELHDRAEIKINDQGISWHTDKYAEQPPYVKLVPLNEVIAESVGSSVASRKTIEIFDRLCDTFGSEIATLLKADIKEVAKTAGDKVAEGIDRVRSGKLMIEPGYDGEYGKVRIWGKDEKAKQQDDSAQLTLDF